MREPHPQAQAALGIRKERVAAFAHRPPEADRGEDVLQAPPRAQVHMHVAGGDERQVGGARERAQGFEPAAIVRTAVELGGDPGASRKAFGEPFGITAGRGGREGEGRRDEQRQAVVQTAVEVGARQPVAAFLRAAPSTSDQLGEVAVARAVRGEQDELRTVFEPKLGPDQELERLLLGGDMRPHRPGNRAFVGDRKRRVAKRRRAHDELFRLRGAAQEAEVREAVQLGVGGEHQANSPCRNHPPSALRSRYTHTRTSSGVRATK